MKNIVQQMCDKAGVIPVGEVIDNTGRYQMIQDGSAEIEVLEFIYGLVKAVKPKAILETGTYAGWSSAVMAQGMKDNGFGNIVTLDIDQKWLDESRELCRKLELTNVIRLLKPSLNYQTSKMYDILFLDSEPEIRFEELMRFYDNVSPGGFIGIHDLPPTWCQGMINMDHPDIMSWPFGDVPEKMLEKMKTELVNFHLPTPRGMVWFYKRREEDYVPTE